MPPPTDERLDAVTDAIVEAADAAGIGLLVTSGDTPDQTTLYVSDAAAALFGRTREQLLDQPAFAFAAPGEAPKLKGFDEQARRGETIPRHLETALVRSDGTSLPIEIAFSLVELEKRVVAVTFLSDLSERLKAESGLRRSEAQFRSLIELAPEAIWIFDARGLCFANLAAARLFGFDESAGVIGLNPRSFAHPDDVPMLEKRVRALLSEGALLPPCEYRAKRRDGSWLTVEVSSIRIDYEGRPAGLSFGRDVSERKQLEARRLQADRLATLGMLAGGMAHAINNPLTYVLLNLDHLSRTLPKLAVDPSLVQQALQRVEEVCEGAERVAGVVRRMRRFARFDDEPSGVSVRDVLEAAIEIVGHEIRHRGSLVTELKDVPPVFTSPNRLEQAFLNLLLFAAQSLPEDAPAAEVRVVLDGGDEGPIVDVSFGGNGGSEPHGSFAPLRDVPEAMHAGLGLVICRGIIESLGGELFVSRTPAPGTTYRVVLAASLEGLERPASQPAPSKAPSIPPTAEAPRGRVLVVDDDPGVGSALRLMLEDEHDVEFLTNGAAALELLLADAPYDVVFCDLMMPETSGLDIYEALREKQAGAERRIVFMTGGAFTAEAERFLDALENPRVEKPFNLKALRSLVRKAVERRS
jgi:PAS domain S-box-containing protein